VTEVKGTDGSGQVGRAILVNLTGIVLLDMMGLTIKYLSAGYGAPELAAYRNVFGMIPSLLLLWFTADWHARGRRLCLRQWHLGLLRGAIVTVAQISFYLAVSRMAYATAATIVYSMSLFATAFSVLILGDRVGSVRWLAVLVGFTGVTLITRPGSDSFSPEALLPLGAAAGYGLSTVLVKLFDADAPSPLINLYSSCGALVGVVIFCLATGGFSPIRAWTDFAWICAMGMFGGSGVLLLVISYRMTEPSNLAPFNYCGIISSFIGGWVLFGEAPIDRLFPGALLIAAGGMLVVWRERRARRRPAPVPAPVEAPAKRP